MCTCILAGIGDGQGMFTTTDYHVQIELVVFGHCYIPSDCDRFRACWIGVIFNVLHHSSQSSVIVTVTVLFSRHFM